jgi:hypothetical protein
VAGSVYIAAAAEGVLDEAVADTLIRQSGAETLRFYGGRGKANLLRQLPGFNAAARHGPWFVLIDLDDPVACPPARRRLWLPDPAPTMCFRIAVREVESWLLADRERAARFLGVPLARLPQDPDQVADPKQSLVNLARRSNKADIRADLVPRAGSGRSEGPGYTAALSQFVRDSANGWRPHAAAEQSESLSRCLSRLTALVEICKAAD